MDAASLLKSQGWRGQGFSLHPTDNTVGLARPLLISRNTEGRGVGQRAPHWTSDQWWLSAFDEKLKGLDTRKGKVVQMVEKGKLERVVAAAGEGKYEGAAGLYTSFVSGGYLEGTMPSEIEEEGRDAVEVMILKVTGHEKTKTVTPVTIAEEGKENKRRKKEKKANETKVERRARREAKRIRRAAKEARRKAAEEALGTTTDVLPASPETTEPAPAQKDRKAEQEERRRKREAKRAQKHLKARYKQ